MKSDGICNSFIIPTPYLEMGYFLPFYTENAACIYGLIFSLPTGISFTCVVCVECMLDVKIKCLCLKYVKIVLEKCFKNVLNITHLPVL